MWYYFLWYNSYFWTCKSFLPKNIFILLTYQHLLFSKCCFYCCVSLPQVLLFFTPHLSSLYSPAQEESHGFHCVWKNYKAPYTHSFSSNCQPGYHVTEKKKKNWGIIDWKKVTDKYNQGFHIWKKILSYFWKI